MPRHYAQLSPNCWHFGETESPGWKTNMEANMGWNSYTPPEFSTEMERGGVTNH